MTHEDEIMRRTVIEMAHRCGKTYNRMVILVLYLERRWVRRNFRSWIYYGYY